MGQKHWPTPSPTPAYRHRRERKDQPDRLLTWHLPAQCQLNLAYDYRYRHHDWRPMIKPLTIALAALTLTAPATAHADTPDQKFLNAVNSQGINTSQPDQLITYAHTMCDIMGTPAALGPETALMAQGYTPQQVFYIAADGIRTYCPEKSAADAVQLAPPMP